MKDVKTTSLNPLLERAEHFDMSVAKIAQNTQKYLYCKKNVKNKQTGKQ